MKSDPFGGNIPVGDGISLAGSYRLVASLVNPNDPTNEHGDFIDNDCFDYLVVDERAGFRLPMIKLAFRLYNYDILSYMNQGNILRIYVTSFIIGAEGSTIEEVGIFANFSILKPEITSEANMKRVVLTGMLNPLSYMDDRHSRTFKNMTSKDAMFWVASQYFETDFGDDPASPNDVQNWVQSNLSDKDFVKHLQTYSNYEGSFPIVGITSNGKFRHRNFSYLVKETKPTFKFVFSESEPNSDTMSDPESGDKAIEVVHNGDIVDISDAGVLNLWRAAGTIVPVINMDSIGPPVMYQESVDVGMLTGMSTGNRNIKATPSILAVEYDNDNTYSGFPGSKTRNISGLAMYSSQTLSFSYKWKIHPLQILDFVTLEEPSAQWSSENGQSNPNLTALTNTISAGKYVVSRITRKFSKIILNRVEVCRESSAEQLGALK